MAKIKAIWENAVFVLDISQQHQSFGNFLADWPEDDIVGLLLYLDKHGSRLGGRTRQYFLRFVGKGTFCLRKMSSPYCSQRALLKRSLLAKPLCITYRTRTTNGAMRRLPSSHSSRAMTSSLSTSNEEPNIFRA